MFIFKETKPCPSQKEIFPAFGQPQWGWLASSSELNTKSHAAHFKHCPGIVRTLLGKYQFLRCCTWVSSLQPRGGSRKVEAAPSISQPGLVSKLVHAAVCALLQHLDFPMCRQHPFSLPVHHFCPLPFSATSTVFHQKCLLASP